MDEIVVSKIVIFDLIVSNELFFFINVVVLIVVIMDVLFKVYCSKKIYSLDLNYREYCINKEKNDVEGVLGKMLRVIIGVKCVFFLLELSKKIFCEDVVDDVVEIEVFEFLLVVEKKDGVYE